MCNDIQSVQSVTDVIQEEGVESCGHRVCHSHGLSIAPADWNVAIVTPRRRFASVRGETARWQRFAESKVGSRETAFSCASCWVLQKSFKLGENHKTGGV